MIVTKNSFPTLNDDSYLSFFSKGALINCKSFQILMENLICDRLILNKGQKKLYCDKHPKRYFAT